MANVTSLLTSLCENFKNPASTSNSGTLPSQTVTNPRQQINAITTDGKTLEEPSIPLVPSPDVSKPQKEPEQNPETSTEKVQNPNLENTAHVPSPGEEDLIFMEIPNPKAKKTINVEIQDLNSPNPNSNQSRLPYPERMKVRGHDKPSAQYSRFLKMFKQLSFWGEIGLKDALVEMPKFNKWLSSLLRNKEKLEEIAITTVNAECSAIIMNKVPEKLEDPGKFLIPCALQELQRLSSLPTRSITHADGHSEDVVVRVDVSLFLRNLCSSPIKTSCDSLVEEFTDEFALPNSLPPGDDVSILKKNLQEDTFRIISNPLFKIDDNFKSSNVNPLFEEKEKDVKIKSSTSSTLTSPEASELEDYLEKDSIPPGIDLALPTTLEVLSSNPTFPTLTGEKVCSWKTPMFFSLVRFVWKMMNRIAIRKKIICLLTAFLHKKPKTLSRPQEIEEIKEQEEKVSSDVQINTIVMPIRITFDNPIDFNDHFSKPKDLKKDLPISFDSNLRDKVWICQISQEISQKRTRERMSDQEAKDLKAEAREIMPQPSTIKERRGLKGRDQGEKKDLEAHGSGYHGVFRAVGQLIAIIDGRGRRSWQYTTTHANYSLPEYDSFLFEIEPDQEGLISIDNPEFESFHFDPTFSRPPPEPPDVEILEPENNNFDVLNNDEPFDQGGGENVVFLNDEEDDSFTFTIRTFLPFVTYPEVTLLSCSTGSEDTIFDPAQSHLRPLASHRDGIFISINVFFPNIK
ncbi:hypothetical protein Tco_1561799 [Tanacetum coccineum]